MNIKATETPESQEAGQTQLTSKPHSHGCGSHCHHDHTEQGVRSIPQSRRALKIGRNDPCLCGSGKKYKKCCLAY